MTKRIIGLTAACGFAAFGLGSQAFAVGGGASYAGTAHYQAQQAGPKCPGIGYQITTKPGQNPSGYAWFNDISGVSKFSGTLDQNTGDIQLTVTSIDGKGPTGAVTGKRNSDGSFVATLKGPDCSNGMFMRERAEEVSGDQK